MKRNFLLSALACVGTALIMTSCAPATDLPTPSVDAMSTAAIEIARIMQTQTARAASPTPTLITPSPTPSMTLTPAPTEPFKRPVVTAFAGCWMGPGPKYKLIGNISARRYVELLGIGSIPGWYIVRHPDFHKPCWIEAIYLKLDPRVDTSAYPVTTPTAP